MAEGRKPPRRIKSTVRPYISETLLAGVRKNRPDLDYLTEREFIEAALLAFQRDFLPKPIDNKHEEATPANVRNAITTDNDHPTQQLSDPTDLDF